MKFSDSLQNLMQYRGPIGALWGKKFQLDSKRFGRYRFPGVGQFFDSRTVCMSWCTRRSNIHGQMIHKKNNFND